MKYVARVIALASILLGAFLLSRTYMLERNYGAVMPRGRDLEAGRIVPVVIDRDVSVYVDEAEARALDAARTYETFGWPFLVLGVLLGLASRDRRPPAVEVAPESESPWTARR